MRRVRCLDPKLLAVAAVVGVALVFVVGSNALVLLPLLLVAACALPMLAMVFLMSRGGDHGNPPMARAEDQAREMAALREQIGSLEARLEAPRDRNGAGPAPVDDDGPMPRWPGHRPRPDGAAVDDTEEAPRDAMR